MSAQTMSIPIKSRQKEIDNFQLLFDKAACSMFLPITSNLIMKVTIAHQATASSRNPNIIIQQKYGKRIASIHHQVQNNDIKIMAVLNLSKLNKINGTG